MEIFEEGYTTPVLVSTTKSGKNKYWQGHVVFTGERYFTQTSYWQQDGVVTWSEPKYVSPTNVGKTNERSGFEQAKFNIDSLVAKQQDKGYYGEGVEKLDIVLPMLANKWADKKHLVTFPVFVQPKLDGVRMLYENGHGWTRKGKDFPAGVLDHLWMDTDFMVLDGELMLPSNLSKPYVIQDPMFEGQFLPPNTFQDTMRAVKKYREESKQLVFHVFDIISSNPFVARLEMLEDFFRDYTLPENVVIVPTTLVENEDELFEHHAKFMEDGYEGTIIRTMNGEYEINHRSSGLLKLKNFDDNEFTIIDVEDGEGKDKGAAIFVCITDEHNLFRVRPRGTMEFRQDVWANKDNYRGSVLTVRYQGLSEDGIPRFPVGIAIRDYE